MKISEAFPSKYLKSGDLQGQQIPVVISHFSVEEVGDDEHKGVLYFQGKQKGLVLNRINADTISLAYGDETDSWPGRQIILYVDPTVRYAGRLTGGLRVRVPVPTRPTPQQQPAPPQQPHTELNPPPNDDIPF